MPLFDFASALSKIPVILPQRLENHCVSPKAFLDIINKGEAPFFHSLPYAVTKALSAEVTAAADSVPGGGHLFRRDIMERGQDIAHQPESVRRFTSPSHASPASASACAPSSID